MTTLQRTIGPAARRPRLGRWASLCFALFCLGFTFQIPSSTSAAAPHQEATPVPSPTPTCEQRCNARAHEVYEACIAMGRGPDACEKESSAAREACLRECPRATAVPSCEDKCRQRAEAVFKACIDAGRSEEACHKESADAKLACLKECPRPDATATPKPIERSCTERCAAHAEEIYKTCIAAGRGADACQNESRQAKEACLKDCPRDATKTPGPPDRTCEQRCAAAAEEGYKACIAAGRGPDVCEAEAKVAREKCVGACPKPEPTRIGNCEEKCKKRFDEVYNACIASGRGPDACENEARQAKEACFKECPREATKTPAAEEKSCEQRCAAEAEAVYKACIAGGHGPDVCEREAKTAREKCASMCPKPEPTRIGNCEEKCKKRFDEVYNACIASGRGPDDCEAEAHKAKEACLLACPRPEGTKTPQSLSCEGRCKEHAAAELKACLQGGGDEKACHERSNKALLDCLARCPRPTPKPESCRDQCNAKAEAVYAACRERGAGEEDCLDEKNRALNACVAACERPTESCEAGCKQRAEAVFKACRTEGGEEAVCRERMRSALEVCLKGCPRPQPIDCQDRCAKAAREVLAKCLAEGGEQQACEGRAKESYDLCIKHCDKQVPPAPIPDCSTKCARAGAAVFQRCLAGGGTVESCTEVMAQEIQRCLTECLRPVAAPISGR